MLQGAQAEEQKSGSSTNICRLCELPAVNCWLAGSAVQLATDQAR